MEDEEIWVEIKGYPDYHISNFGNIKSLGRYVNRNGGMLRVKEKILRPYVAKKRGGYLECNIYRDAVRKRIKYHVAVAEAFIGPRPDGFHVCHYDGDPSNNKLVNIRYCSPSQNEMDKIRHGYSQIGERNRSSVLEESDILFIRSFSKSGISGADIARIYKVSSSCIYSIINRETWVHL